VLRRLAAYGIVTAAAAGLAATAFPTAAGAAAGAAHPAAARPAAAVANASGTWTGTWATAPQSGGASFDQQTIRQIVHTSISGTVARIEISNAFGTAPLTVSDVHIALAGSGSAITSGTDQTVTFGGSATTTIAAGGTGISDTISYAIPALTNIAISFYLPDPTGASTYQQIANQTNYIASGDVSGAAGLPNAQTATSYYFLTNLDVQNTNSEGSVVALGASITDGYASTLNANTRWTNGLATRLNAAGDTIGVLNEGISGNRLLVDGAGQSAINRFDRDVLGQPGVRWVIFSDDPINDLGSTSPQPTSAQLIAGIQQLITTAHQNGIKFICSTLTPYQGAAYWNSSGETAREAINAWIRAGDNGCDGVIDQDDATHNPADPTEYLPAYDSGDHLHPNDAGYQAIANAVNLGLFTQSGAYSGTPAAVPGTVLAANYDTGGQGLAYNVTATNGTADSYRPDGVDLEACTDTGCGYDIGWTATGQWFNYTVDVATAGRYTVSLQLASPSGVSDALHIADSAGSNLSGAIAAPDTGGWQTWAAVATSVTLPAGVQTLTLDQDNGGWNIYNVTLAAASSGINTAAWYEVVNTSSGLCLSAAGAGTANGTAVQQLACTGATSQLWQFDPAATGYYEVLNDNAQAEGESWNITGGVGATASGDLLQTWNYGGPGNTNALFAATAQTSGSYTFTVDNSRLCVDVPGSSTTSGVQLEQYTCNGTGAQQFTLIQE
jgi:lysophospholipase L1-like esterase